MRNEIALPEEQLHLDARGQRGLQFRECLLDCRRELERVEAGRLIDAQDDARLAVYARVTAHRLNAILHARHVADEHGPVAELLDDGAAEFVQIGAHAEIAHHDFLRGRGEVAARRVVRGLRDGGFELGKSDAHRREPVRVGHDVDLLHAAPDGQHFGDARDALQPPRDRPVRERAQVARRHVLAPQADEQNFAHERGHRREAGLDAFGQAAACRLQPLLHELPRAIDIRAPRKFCKDERKAHIGIRSQAVESSDALHRRLDGLRDERLDLLRREAGTFGEDGDGRLRHVRQHFHRQFAGGLHAEHEQQDRQRQNDGPVAQRKLDEFREHGAFRRRWVCGA